MALTRNNPRLAVRCRRRAVSDRGVVESSAVPRLADQMLVVPPEGQLALSVGVQQAACWQVRGDQLQLVDTVLR